MPILARIIAQRLFFVVLSSLTFLGISPEIDIKTESEAQIATEERKEIITETIQIPIPKINILDLDLPKADATHPDDIKTPEPIIPKAVVKPKPQITIPPVKDALTTKKEISISIPKSEPDNSTSASIEDMIVNILCIKQSGNKINLSTGSGVIISSKGVVLTNSHVAQHFLLKEAGYNCTLRRENIPTYGFNAIPLYISEKWIENNYKQLSNSSPVGTGEDDYALLLITSNTNPTISLPTSFPTLPISTNSSFADIGDTVTIAGYPGKITSSLEIAKNTALQTDKVSIREVFTLNDNTVDVISTTETEMAIRGISGGGVFKNNTLAGIMVSTNQLSNSDFVINALTLDYINRDLKKETGKNLSGYLSSDLKKQAEDFSSVAPRLTELLMKNF